MRSSFVLASIHAALQRPFILLAPTILASPLAAQQVDVIMAVDGSGSMAVEAAMVELALNPFAEALADSGIDLHLILLSRSGSSSTGVCVPAPLGSGSCPADENLPGLRHVILSGIGTGNLFASILASYPSWSSSLRPGSTRSLIVVSDADDDMPTATFDVQLRALDPDFADYRCSAFVADSFTLMDPCASVATEVGQQYLALVSLVGGEVVDLCDQDFAPGFAQVASAVAAQAWREAKLRKGSSTPPPGAGSVLVPFRAGGVPVLQAPLLASARLRNGSGENPTCFASARPPRLGSRWIARVDASAAPGARLSAVLVALEPSPAQASPFGQVLVRLPRDGGHLLIASRVASSGGLDRHALSIPDDPALLGLEVHAQAFVVGDRVQLCNALDLLLGL